MISYFFKHIYFYSEILLILVFCSNLLSNEIEIVYKNDLKNSRTLKTTVKNDLNYISLNDLVNVMGFKTLSDNSKGTIELYFFKYHIRIAANSPFILLKKKSDNKIKIFNLPVNIFLKDQEYYVPPLFFTPILSKATGASFTYSADKNRITSSIPFKKLKSDIIGFDISNMLAYKKANGITIKFPSRKKARIEATSDKNDNSITLKISGATIDEKKLKSGFSRDIINKISINKYPSSYNLTIFFNEKIESYDTFQSDRNNDIFLTVFKKFSIDSMFTAERRRKKIETLSETDQQRKKWKLNVVVIDAGHGGKDPGAIGISKTHEKDINLKIALKLGLLLEKKLNIKVFYTRKTDEFIPLYRRGQIANEKKGNLFISIHCNSLEKGHSQINGFETYILSPGKTDKAIAVAEKENSVIKLEDDYKKRYKSLSEESFIITSLAQNAFVRFSETFAEIISERVTAKLKLKNNGVNQAGFYVLVGASMPSILVESGYLSNKKDETFLCSEKGQQKVAECIFEAIKEFQQTYEKALQEGK